MTDGNISYPTNVPIAPNPMEPYLSMTGITADDMKPEYCWTNKFQWLPCEVQFTGRETEVRITSYINNLHPKNRRAYTAIEKLISTSIEPWNQVVKKVHGRYPPRIRSYEYEANDLGDESRDADPFVYKCRLPNKRWTKETWAAYLVRAREYFALPRPDLK
ncbi:hypothetical protein BO94DRAFT_600986, partial [Aspergillus sclerotioniger CBS 115572]